MHAYRLMRYTDRRARISGNFLLYLIAAVDMQGAGMVKYKKQQSFAECRFF